MAEAAGGPFPRVRGRAVRRLEGVETAAEHEPRLLAQDIADGATPEDVEKAARLFRHVYQAVADDRAPAFAERLHGEKA